MSEEGLRNRGKKNNNNYYYFKQDNEQSIRVMLLIYNLTFLNVVTCDWIV